ncbi:MAG: hypothetical protein LBD02_04335 [Christensenellaceae bacterium]|nr:hypothetical protein [Christensenellaceae bacterium]
MDYSVVKLLRRGTALAVWGYAGVWARVTTQAGKSGWAHNRCIRMANWKLARLSPVTRPRASRKSLVSKILPQPKGGESTGASGSGGTGSGDIGSGTSSNAAPQSAVDKVVATEWAQNGNNEVRSTSKAARAARSASCGAHSRARSTIPYAPAPF